MLEFLLIAILIVLLLIFLVLRAMIPAVHRVGNIVVDSNEQRIDGTISVRKNRDIEEVIEFTPFGLHRRFDGEALIETEYFLDRKENSSFYLGNVTFSCYENAKDMILDDKGYILDLKCHSEKSGVAGVHSRAYATLICTADEYQLISDQVKSNDLIALIFNDARIHQKFGDEGCRIKARTVSFHVNDTTRKLYSVRQFVERFREKKHELSGDLKHWYSEWDNRV